MECSESLTTDRGNEDRDLKAFEDKSSVQLRIRTPKSDLDSENTMPKTLVNNQGFDSGKGFKLLLSDNESSCSSYESFTSERRSEDQKKLLVNRSIRYAPVPENNNGHSMVLSRRQRNEVSQYSAAESNLVQMLRRQIESLALKEHGVQQALSDERIEDLVSKVEEEVEFEGMVEDLCMRFKAEGEIIDIERREREWERERREVQLEEEVELLQNKVEFLEQDIRRARLERDHALKEQAERHEANGEGHAVQRDDQELPDSEGEISPAILRDLLRQAEDKAERDRRMLEETFQDEQQLWIENEQVLHNQIAALENGVNCMKVALKEKESALTVERERRRQYGLEIDKVLAFWREENSIYNSVRQRLKKIEDLMHKSNETLKHLMTMYPDGETEVHGLLSEISHALEDAEREQLDLSSPLIGQQHLEWELVRQWKSQRDFLEEEKEKLQQKLDLSTEMAKDNQDKMERTWQEKEMTLRKQLRDLEAILGRNAASSRNTTSEGEKQMFNKDSVYVCEEWQEEEAKINVMLAEREQLMKEHTQEWSLVLDAKEEELCALKSTQKKLVNSLTSSKQQLLNLKRQLAKRRRGIMVDSASKVMDVSPTSNALGGLCSDESDVETNCSTDFMVTREQTETNGDEEHYLDAQQLSVDISKEIVRLARELRQEQDKLEKERLDVRIGTQQLKDERKELENKVADTLCLMEDLREQIKVKEGQMEWQRKQMDLILSAKDEETQQLKNLLKTKDLDTEKNVQKFKADMELIEKEVEKERKERENVMDMHFSSRRKLVQEMKEKEARWGNEIEEMSQETEHLRREMDEKNQIISKLKKDLRDYELNAEQSLIKQVESCDFISAVEEMPNDYVSTGVALTKPGSIRGGGFCSGRDVEWQDLISKIAGFDNQIAEAMLAIQSLKEELNTKEKELQRARLQQDSERKATWINEQLETNIMEEPRRLLERGEGWGEREHLPAHDNEDLIKLLEEERADTADAMSILQGAVKELQWALKHSKEKELTSFELDREAQNVSLKGDLVKVHASHLQELDAYILELKMKVEEAETRARTAEIALAVNNVKEAARNKRPVSTSLKVEKEWMEEEDEASRASMTRKGWVRDDLRFQAQSPSRRQSLMGRHGSGSPGPDLRNARPSQRWSRASFENSQLWDIGANSSGPDASSNSSCNGWMTVRGMPDESLAAQDPFQQMPMTLAVSTPPPRGQRKWLVDAIWLDNVRKEQSFLKQQLDSERQKVSMLRQVEVEKNWLEATIVEALEQKKESDTRVLELERKVAFLESMINRKGVQGRSPRSSPFHKGGRV